MLTRTIIVGCLIIVKFDQQSAGRWNCTIPLLLDGARLARQKCRLDQPIQLD